MTAALTWSKDRVTNWRKRRVSLPLLVKELTELSARKRTYVMRVVYALALFGYSIARLYAFQQATGGSPMEILGHGRELFDKLIQIQFAGITIFLPAMMCSAIAHEKERNTLAVLFMTNMKPWEIIVQKYLGRLVPMLTFLLLSMPLLAIAYGFGGVTIPLLLVSIFTLLLACLQLGALCLMMSAYCTTTISAICVSYMMWLVMMQLSIVAAPNLLLFIPDSGVRTWGLLSLLLLSLPSLALTVVCLCLSRHFLVTRAFVPTRNLLLDVFRKLDAMFKEMNDNLCNGVELISHKRKALPDDRPVAWMEVTKRSIGKAHYLFRILVITLVPTLFIATSLLAFDYRRGQATSLASMMFVLWAFSILMLIVQGATTFAGERSRQTLDVLLTIPMSGRDIVREKSAALRRLSIVLAISLIATIAVEGWWEAWEFRHPALANRKTTHVTQAKLYWTCSALSVVVYLPMFIWFSMWIGIRARSQSRAVIRCLATALIWCVAPLAVAEYASAMLGASGSRCVSLLSPAGIIVWNEMNTLQDHGRPWLVMIANFAIHGSVLGIFRTMCLMNADRYLGRARVS